MIRARSTLIVTAAAASAVAAMLAGGSSASAAPLYSFETLYNNAGTIDATGTRPDNFFANGGDTVIAQDTIGATDGPHSMKFAQGPAATFTGAWTALMPPALQATTTTALSFDLTVPSGGALASGFARIGLSQFGTENDSPDPMHPTVDQLQTPGFAEQNINLAAGGTYHLTIPLLALFDPRTFDLYTPFSRSWGTTPDKLTPTMFEFYINKSPDVSYTVYLDNVQTLTAPVANWATDNGGDWSDSSKWKGVQGSGGGTEFVPNSPDTFVNFGGIFDPGARTINVDSPRTIGGFALNGGATFTIGGTGTLTLSVTSGQSSITDNRGVHLISAPLALASDTKITVASAVTP